MEEKSDMLGIEEALNSIETAQILEMVTGRKQEIDGYKAAGFSATRLLQHSDLAKIMRISQFRGDNSWIQYLGEERSKVLIENFDILANALYVSIRDINTKTKREALCNKMRLAQEAIDDFVDSYFPAEGVGVSSIDAVETKGRANKNVAGFFYK